MTDRQPIEAINEIAARFVSSSDGEVLAALSALPPLADEDDTVWDSEEYWMTVAYPYLALADVTSQRRLRPAIRLLLDRACFGDPGEIMRGLRHNLEAIVAADWAALADECLRAAESPRLGTRMWAIDELVVLDDARAAPVFQAAVREAIPEIAAIAKVGLRRLARASHDDGSDE